MFSKAMQRYSWDILKQRFTGRELTACYQVPARLLKHPLLTDTVFCTLQMESLFFSCSMTLGRIGVISCKEKGIGKRLQIVKSFLMSQRVLFPAQQLNGIYIVSVIHHIVFLRIFCQLGQHEWGQNILCTQEDLGGTTLQSQW